MRCAEPAAFATDSHGTCALRLNTPSWSRVEVGSGWVVEVVISQLPDAPPRSRIKVVHNGGLMRCICQPLLSREIPDRGHRVVTEAT